MNYKDIVIKKLTSFTLSDFIITEHARRQAIFRSIDLDEVKENIINPKRLSFAIKDKSGKEKYDAILDIAKPNVKDTYWLSIQNV